MTPQLWARLCVALAVVLGAFAAGCRVEGWRLGEQIATLKATQATARADAADEALNRAAQTADILTGVAATAVLQVDKVRAKMQALGAKAYAAPLPVDCRPDDERLRDRNAAIAAYNAARAGSDASP